MKRLWLLLCAGGMLLAGAELPAVHSVYLLPMTRGLDQYLANRLTNEHVFQVVTDPKLADAIFTDRIGDAFQAQMESLLPPPAPPPPAKKDKEKEKDSNSGEQARMALPTDTANKLSNPALNSSFGRGRGTVFLVDAKSHQVVWSTYVVPKRSGSSELDRTASDIVSRLKKDLNPKK